jgi:beta-phosphoglucomutase-like phosphatase (HAD superfamily)
LTHKITKRVSPPKLVIFDCDGVLVDSELLANQVFLEKLKALGLNPTIADLFERFVGRTLSNCLSQVEQMLGRPVPDSFLRDLDQATFQAFEQDLKAVEGIEFVLNTLDTAGIQYCVASSGSQNTRPHGSFAALGRTHLQCKRCGPIKAVS